MKTILLLVLFYNYTLFANSIFVQNEAMTSKIKKLVQKEERIAFEINNYVVQKGTIPSLSDLDISDDNLFGAKIILNSDLSINSNINENTNLNNYAFDYYYSNENRTYTNSPYYKTNTNTTLKYHKIREFIKNLIEENRIVYLKPANNKSDKYYFTPASDLRYFDKTNEARYILNNEDMVVHEDEIIIDEGTAFEDFKLLTNDILFIGQRIFHLVNGSFEEYIYLGDLAGLKKLKSVEKKEPEPDPITDENPNNALLDLSLNGGGMIVNGDLYSWGNNQENAIGINLNKVLDSNNYVYNESSIITTPVRAKIKTYDTNSNVDDNGWYSSPMRTKFKDLMADNWHGLCATTFEGELYCNGAYNLEYTYFDGYSRGYDKSIMYRHTYFGDSSWQRPKKYISKIFAMEAQWITLVNTKTDENGNESNGEMYFWGQHNRKGYFGVGTAYYIDWTRTPTKLSISGTRGLRDITYTKEERYQRIAALSDSGDIYFWGLDDYSTGGIGNSNCNQNLYSDSNHIIGQINHCEPNKVDAKDKNNNKLIFDSIKSSQRAFIAKTKEGDFYKVYQEMYYQSRATSITNLLGTNYDINIDGQIRSVDFTNKAGDSSAQGIVWINENYELKGDMYTSENKNDNIFKEAIKSMKWRKVRTINNENGICAINTDNQTYCWGVISAISKKGSTFSLPIFNTNIYDEDKDLMTAKIGANRALDLPVMTSGDWKKTAYGYNNQFFLKYPTYIGGLNYNFDFK